MITQQTLEYKNHEDELACLHAVALELQRQNIEGAMLLIVARQTVLQQAPKVVAYDPRAVA